MVRARAAATALAVTAIVPMALLIAGCSRPPEQQMLTQFFRAVKARDNATLAMMSAVAIDPREKGTVEDFSITSVGAETKAPVDLKALVEADRKAKDAEAEFQKRKREYSDANIDAINAVLKLERDPKAKMGWAVVDGTLAVAAPDGNADLVTDRTFQDMKLHVEWNVDPKSNSGVYLRGRYEVQILDDATKATASNGTGGTRSAKVPSWER